MELEGHIEEDVTYKYQDWLNAHHLDYRGLIYMGLAKEATQLERILQQGRQANGAILTEILEAVRVLQEANPHDEGIQNWVRNYFPELKEPEDERIRKWIIKQIKTYDPSIIRDEALAWLEKQGLTFTKKDVDDAYLKGVCDTKHELEKQGEQKSNK